MRAQYTRCIELYAGGKAGLVFVDKTKKGKVAEK